MVSRYTSSDTPNIFSVLLIWRWQKQAESFTPEFDPRVDPETKFVEFKTAD